MNIKRSPKSDRKNKIDKKKSTDKKNEDDDKKLQKSIIEKPKSIEKIVDNFQPNSIKMLKISSEGSGEISNVGKIKNAFELLMVKGDTPPKKNPLKRRIKRCDGPSDGQKKLMDRWLRN